ncbi:hypothetical protein HMPREF0004_5173 [Achromobacter piechaudii ATCC 43553]|uniref:DUF4148 domain-containing protein n=2 Tax=Achromobacter piechaudii TaxID=72556 RepID=D4XI76_9BURK|nr:hypothetical protein HMPREF0004_5173 [Achromobacter piechaudii ATCC 43553]
MPGQALHIQEIVRRSIAGDGAATLAAGFVCQERYMKTLTTTLLLCAGLSIAGAVQAQPSAQAPQYKRDLYGDWRVAYPAPVAKSRDQVEQELAQAKAHGQYSFGQEDYPPAMATGPSESRAQVDQELQQAQMQGQMASDEEDYPPPAMAHSGMSDIH